MIPQSDHYPEQIGDAIQALLGPGGCSAGREKLTLIAYPVRDVAKRPALTRAVAGRIFQRDHFTCRYCGGRTILTSVMELVATIYPDIFPFHPNWTGGLTHPAILTRTAVVDRVHPGARRGDEGPRCNRAAA